MLSRLLILLAIIVSISMAQAQTKRLKLMTSSEKAKYVETYIREKNLAPNGLPGIDISGEQLGRTYGTYFGAGNVKYGGTPTIVLNPLAFESSGRFEVAVLHEMMHYSIETTGKPEGLQRLLQDARDAFLEKFDVSDIPQNLNERENILEGWLPISEAEELYISTEVLKMAGTFQDKLNAIASARATLSTYRKEYDDYFKSGKTAIFGGKKYHARPISGRGSADRSKKKESMPNLTGDYECDDCGEMSAIGTHVVDLGAGRKSVQTISPISVTQEGSSVIIRETVTQDVDGSSTPSASQNAGRVVILSEGRGKLAGDVAAIDMIVTMQTSGGEVTRMSPEFKKLTESVPPVSVPDRYQSRASL
jgi:hypothetical protein